MLELSDEKLRQDLLDKLIDAKLSGPTTQLGFQCNPELLPERCLPHGNWSNLFTIYAAYAAAEGEQCASKSVFYTIAKRWKVCLRFPKASMHSVCKTCSTLKSSLANAAETLLQPLHCHALMEELSGLHLRTSLNMRRFLPDFCITTQFNGGIAKSTGWPDPDRSWSGT